MKAFCLFCAMCFVIHFDTWGKQISHDPILIQRAIAWYEKELQENPGAAAFKDDYTYRWESARVLENKEVVVPLEVTGNNRLQARLILDISGEKARGEILYIIPRKPLPGDINEVIKRRAEAYIPGFTGRLVFHGRFPWELSGKTVYFYQGKKERTGYPETDPLIVPVLQDGMSPQRALHEKHLRRLSGYSIFEFLVRKDGTVDSIQITSRYYAGRGLDSLTRNIDEKDRALLSGFKFKALPADTRVQCKVYTEYFNNRDRDPFRNFNYGLQELHQSETDTYFRDADGQPLEYIIQNGVVIFAPTYLWGIT